MYGILTDPSSRDADSAVSRRDQLVQQLLEERRQRLEKKLAETGVQESFAGDAFATPVGNSLTEPDDHDTDELQRRVPGFAARGSLNRGSMLGDSASRRLDAVLGGASSTPPRSRRQSAPEMAGRSHATYRATDLWSPDDGTNEFTFASYQEEPSSSSRSRSMERRSVSPRSREAQYHTVLQRPPQTVSSISPNASEPNSHQHQMRFAGSARADTNGNVAHHVVDASRRRPQSAPRAGRSSSAASAARHSGSFTKASTATRRASTPNSASGVRSTPQREQSLGSERQKGSTAARPRSAPPSRRQSGGGHDFNSRLQEWSMRQKSTELKYQKARQINDAKEMENCTFKPEINSKSEFYARRARGCYVEPLEERLHHEADKRDILRQKAKELLEADEMCSYTFQPQINRTGTNGEGDRTPIHKRAEELRQQRLEKTAAREAEEAMRSDCSFQPRISEKSDRIVRKKRDEMYRNLSQGSENYAKLLGPVEDRLYAGAQDLLQRRMSMHSSVTDSQSAPSVDDVSRRICKSSVYFQGPQQDFVTRQRTFELAKQRRHEVRSQHADSECTFKPEISDTSRQIVSSNIEMVGETVEERVNRLAVRDVERRDQVRGALEELHYRECTFKPSLNPTSQMLATKFDDAASFDSGDPCSRVHERLYKISQNRSRCSEDSKLDECTFTPAISAKSSKRYAHVKSRYACSGQQIMDHIHEELARKEEYLNEKRREIESEEAAECTFNPGIRKPYEEPEQAVIVSGLGRFFELRDLARRKQEEQQAREIKVFHPETKAWSEGITIPEPFALSRGVREVPKEADFTPTSEECSFAPKTTESENKKLLQHIMAAEKSFGDATFRSDSKHGCNFHDLTFRRTPPASAYSPAGA